MGSGKGIKEEIYCIKFYLFFYSEMVLFREHLKAVFIYFYK